MKLLLDATYINNSGGFVLLQYLIEELRSRNVDCYFLLDERIKDKDIVPGEYVTYIVGSEKNRNSFYKTEGDKFSHVLCFGNIPPTIRLKAKVFTFFQNVTLAELSRLVPLKERPKWLLKRYYIKRLKRNTDFWIVQTSNTKEILSRKMGVDSNDIITCPFYNDKIFPTIVQKKEVANDYAYIAIALPTKNHQLLLEAWIKLAETDIYPTLHLTIENYPKEVEKLLTIAKNKGCNIINHGKCSLEEVKAIYEQCKSVVYTSMNESFGLGMIEAMNMGCDVIAPNMNYVNSICKPSESFEYNADSIAEAVIRYERGNSPSTLCQVNNEIDRFIRICTN